MTSTWSGRRVTRARTIVATWLPAPCGQCRKTVTATDRWVVGHKEPRWKRPDLIDVVSNWQPEHRACSDATGQAAVIEKARAEALGAAYRDLRDLGATLDPVLPTAPHPGQTPPLPFSLPGRQGEARDAADRARSAMEGVPPSTTAPHPGQTPPLPFSRHAAPLDIREDLSWANHCQSAPAWLQPYLDVPDNASPPLAVTDVHPRSVGSYGPAAIAWIEETLAVTLRWWQRYAIVRQLEHDIDGALVWQVVVESAPRRAGKSVRIKGLALWRMKHGPALFGERQEIVHTGSDLAVCRKVQQTAWRWAEAQGWAVTKGNGKEAIATAEDDAWLVRAQSATYGWDTTLGLVDEGWDVKPETVDEGLEPSLLERQSPQLHLTSTAHRRATSLMRKRLAGALAADDGETLLLLWGARPQDDPSDPETWRAASPHWTESRRRMIAKKYEKAMAGEADPEADDPDPMQGFLAQYLNVWRLRKSATARGAEVVSAEAWSALEAAPPYALPDAAAIESWFTQGVSLALAWRVGSGAIVSVTDHPDLASATAALKESGYTGQPIVGSSLLEDPALRGIRARKGEGRSAVAVVELGRLISETAVTHDGGEHLTDQVLAARTVPGADAPRLVSTERADAIKAAVWAVNQARSMKKPSGTLRMTFAPDRKER